MALDTTPLTETSTYDVSVYPPKGGTTANASDVADGLNHLANRTKYLNDTKFDKAGGTVTGATTFNSAVRLKDDLKLESATDLIYINGAGAATTRTFTRGPKGIYAITISSSQWLMPLVVAAFGGRYEQGSDVATGSPIVWVMNVPPGSTITGASVLVNPPAGHGGVLPTNRPRMAVYVIDCAAGSTTLVAGSDVSDPTTIGTYEDPHTFSSSGLSAAVGDDEIVVVEVWGEYGGSAVAGLTMCPPLVTFTRSKLGEE